MKRYVIYAVAAITLFIVSISGTAVSVAFPEMITSLNTTLILAGWVLSVSQLANTVAMPLAGKACDALGNKFIFILCLVLFTVGSFLCAIAPNIGLLIFFRLIQGVGAGGFLPAATAIVAEEFPNSRQKSIGFFTAIFPIGQIVGPNLGGWLTEAFGWRSTFWMSVPLGIVVLIISLWLLSKQSTRHKARIDLTGAGMLTGIITAVMVGISLLGNTQGKIEWGWVVLFFIIAIVLLVLFLRRNKKVENPFIDVEVLRERPFVATNVYNFIYGMSVLGVMSYIPLYGVSVFNLSTFDSGFILTPRSVGMVAASIYLSMNLVRWGYRWPIFIGSILTVIPLFLLAWVSPGFSLFGWQVNSMLLLSLILLLTGLSQGMIAPASNNACIELMPDKIGTMTGVRGMFRQTGGAISVGVTALLLQNVGDMARGFSLVFMGLGILMLAVLPVVMLIPKGPCSTKLEVSRERRAG